MFTARIQNGIAVAPCVDPTEDATGVVAWVQRMMRRLPAHRTQKKSLRYVEALSLGAKRTVFLIECDGQRFLLADGMSAPVPLTQRFAAEEQR